MALGLQDPIGEWRRNLSERYHCLMVLLLHVALSLCSGLISAEWHLLFLPCMIPALASAHLQLLLPYADTLDNSSARVRDGMIGADPQYGYEKGHWLLDGFRKPGIVTLHA